MLEPVVAEALEGELLDALYEVYCGALELDRDALTALVFVDDVVR